MLSANGRVFASLVIFVLWMAITIVGGNLLAEGNELVNLVSNGIGWHFVAACLFLIAASLLFGWKDIGFNRPIAPRLLPFVWFPVLMITLFLVLAAVLGLPAPAVILLILVNTLMVGFSEETMLRGILFQSFKVHFGLWPAVWSASAIFGAIHIMNVFLTGNLAAAVIQAGAAFMSGVTFQAVRLRTGSLWPGIILHGLWDFGVFMILAGHAPAGAPTPENITIISMLVPMLLVLPNFLFGLWLLRGVKSEE